jgi:rhomboid protease GluP
MKLWTPGPGFVVSPILAAVNVIIFLVLAGMNLSFSDFSIQSIYWLGANYSPWVEAGQWWRFVSSMFLHFGIMHLLFNSVSLLYLGRILEPNIGSIPFTIIYFVTGIAGSFASFTFNKDVYSAGASGAIFGLFGVFLAVLLSNIIRKDIRDEWLKSIGAILVINLGMGLLLPVDNAAHLGGLISGVVIGFAIVPMIKRKLRKRLHR